MSLITILHVDDDSGFLEITHEYLTHQRDSFVVDSTTDTDAALDTLKNDRIDCVVSDYEMNERNGIEFLKRVRACHPDIPFILFTGKGSEDVASHAISAGVTDYIQKQVGTEQYELLANRITNAVNARRSEKSAQRKDKRLDQLLEVVPSCIIEVDPDGTIVYANGYMDDIFGLSPPDAVGQTLNQAARRLRTVDGGPLPESDHPTEQVVRHSAPVTDFRFTVQRPDGTRHILSTNGAPLYDDTGDISRIMLSLHDITERQQSVEVMRRRKEALQDAYRLIAREPGFQLHRIDELMTVAKRAVGTEYATFGRVDDGQYIFEAVAVPGDASPRPGEQSQLDTLPPCQEVVETDEGIVINDIEQEAPELVDPQASMTRHLGIPVTVDGETYGTLCFYDTEQVAASFTDWQRMFVEILADWVGSRLEQSSTDEQRVRP